MTWNVGERRDRVLVFQDNFLDAVGKPVFPVNGMPTRSRHLFWQEDILPTTHLLRRTYMYGGVSDSEEDMLDEAWDWIQKGGRFELPNSRHKLDIVDLNAIPLSVILNRETVNFFLMEEDFKIPPSRNSFEPFVAFKSGTSDWQNDVKRVTFDFVDKMRRLAYEEAPKLNEVLIEAKNVYTDKAIQMLGLEDTVLTKFENTDTITCALLFQYHSILCKREQAVLSNLNL